MVLSCGSYTPTEGATSMFKIANRVWMTVISAPELCYTCMRPKQFCVCK